VSYLIHSLGHSPARTFTRSDMHFARTFTHGHSCFDAVLGAVGRFLE
jgi:hypothetical protein